MFVIVEPLRQYKIATLNLITFSFVDTELDAESKALFPVLQFLFSKRSAFVTGQHFALSADRIPLSARVYITLLYMTLLCG